METLILIFVGFVGWLYFAKFVNDNYQRSRGWSALFWYHYPCGSKWSKKIMIKEFLDINDIITDGIFNW